MSKIVRTMFHNYLHLDSYGDVEVSRVNATNRYEGSDSVGSIYDWDRPLIKFGNKYLTFHYHYGEEWGVENYGDSSYRKLEIWLLDSVVPALADQAPDSALEVLGLRAIMPVFFDLDSTHSALDSSTVLNTMSEDSVYSSLFECFDRTSIDSVGMGQAEGFVLDQNQQVKSWTPAADSSVLYEGETDMIYNGQPFTALDATSSFYVEESGGNLVTRLGGDSEYNIYQSYIDSTSGIDVIYWNGTQDRWEERNFSDDSSLENWEEGFSFSNTGVTTVSTSSETTVNREAPFTGRTVRFTDFLRDNMGIYHYPTFEMAARAQEIIDSEGQWMRTFDSLGAPWSTWTHADRNLGVFDFPGGFKPAIEVYERDSFKPLPYAMFTTY